MSFNIKLMKNNSDANTMTKSTEDIVTLSGVLRDGTSIINPVFMVQYTGGDTGFSNYVDCNYLYVESFKRYYFVNNITVETTNLLQFSCHVDVLMSFKDEILANKAIISRQENIWNLYLDDGSFKTYNNPLIITKAFPSGFTTMQFVLAVAGGGQFIPPSIHENISG